MEQEKIKKMPFRYIVVDNKKEEIIETGDILGETSPGVQRTVLIDLARRKRDLNMDDAEVIVKPF